MTETGRPKGTKNRQWTVDEKLRIVERYFSGTISRSKLIQEEHISDSMLHSWVKKYMENGKDGLKPLKHKGNPYSALTSSKNLPEMKRLQLQVAKLEVEIERLKKGYIVKGDGVNKAFATLKEMNTQ